MLKIDIVSFYQDYNIPYTTEGNHAREGWVQIACPFCGDSTYDKLGFNLEKQYFYCWKCRGHRIEEVLSAILNAPEDEIYEIMNDYRFRPRLDISSIEKPEFVRPTRLVIPGSSLQQIHLQYLIKKNYDPQELIKTWALTGTTNREKYKFRIFYPIFYEYKIVSFQGRDITDTAKAKWKTCPKLLELREHKQCLGGIQKVPGDSVVVVEGASDGWRLGPGAVWTFGTAFTLAQVRLLIQFKRVFILFDSFEEDQNAQKQAKELENMLSAFTETIRLELDDGDPGTMKQKDADYYMTKVWRIR